MAAIGTGSIAFQNVESAFYSYMNDVAESRPLSTVEEAELALRIKAGDLDARNQLVQANLRFVVSVAMEYQHTDIPLIDLISAGNMGLITAAERFDETRGYKFISYAVWWIRQSIQQTVSECARVVRLPVNQLELLQKINRFTDLWYRENAQEPSVEEIAEALGVSSEKVASLLVNGQTTLCLDAPILEESHSLNDLVADENQELPDAPIIRSSLAEDIERVLETLDANEREVIELHFGLGERKPMCLAAIGLQFGVTRERIRQIKEKALKKLRHITRMQQLRPYVEDM